MNHLPNSIKSAENLEIFKKLIKSWQGPTCKCSYQILSPDTNAKQISTNKLEF